MWVPSLFKVCQFCVYHIHRNRSWAKCAASRSSSPLQLLRCRQIYLVHIYINHSSKTHVKRQMCANYMWVCLCGILLPTYGLDVVDLIVFSIEFLCVLESCCSSLPTAKRSPQQRRTLTRCIDIRILYQVYVLFIWVFF